MRKLKTGILVVCLMVCITSTPMFAQTLEWKWLYSTDLGSDKDFSDPMKRINSNGETETMDCGDIYTEDGTLWKDDTAETANVPGGAGVWMGRPFLGAGSAPQPHYDFIGEVPDHPPTPYYDDYFDLDAEDQLRIPLGETIQTWPQQIAFGAAGTPLPLSRVWNNINYHLWNDPDHWNDAGAFYEDHHKNKVHLSYEDDGPPGWAYKQTSGDVWWWDVPTNIAPDNDVEVFSLGLHLSDTVPTTDPTDPNSPDFPQAHLDESDLNLGAEPTPTQYDDDVDALDYHQLDTSTLGNERYRHRYFSVDHEANLGLDPGDIYLCRDADVNNNNNWVNLALALDDVVNFGVPDSTDIDAFEFIVLDSDDTMHLFGYGIDGTGPNGEVTSMYMLAGLFSVDENDPDCPGDESGGLNPGVVYVSDLEGHYAAVTFAWYDDIDAIAVMPEPATMSLLVIGGLAMLKRRRRYA